MDNKAEHFTAYLTWEDQFVQTRGLAERIDDTEEEMVSYIPQNYLETICSTEIEGREFYNELRSVIFFHIDTADRLGCSSLKELIATKTNGKKAAIEIIKERIHKLNLEIIKFEEKLHPNHKQELGNKLKLKKAERAGIEKPLEVKNPDAADPKRQTKIETITKNLAQKQLEIESYTANITKLQTEKIDLSRKINNVNILLQKVENFQQQFAAFHAECDLLCLSLGIAFEKIAKLEVDTTDIKAMKANDSTKLDVINEELRKDNKEGPIYKCSQAKGESELLKAALDEDNKNYQKYLKDVQEWKQQCEAIEGTEQNPEEGTIWYGALIAVYIGATFTGGNNRRVGG